LVPPGGDGFWDRFELRPLVRGSQKNKQAALPVKKKQPNIPPMDPSRSWIYQTALGALGGGLLLAALFYYSGFPEWALGFFLGAFLAPLNFFALTRMTTRVLAAGEGKGRSVFWRQQLLRWFFFGIVSWLLIRISVFCLLGALGSYLWFLAVLAFVGLKTAPGQKGDFSPKK
jgi:hypothetical protein